MIRKLLACLALLTGLSATGIPVQAEVAAAMALRTEASAAERATKHGGTVVPLARRPGSGKFPRAPGIGPRPRNAWRVLTVEILSDRARE